MGQSNRAPSGRVRRGWAICLAPAMLLCARLSVAGESTPSAPPPTPSLAALQLSYERGPGAETCPDDRGVRDLLIAQLGSGANDSTSPVHIRLVVRRRGADRSASKESRASTEKEASSRSEVEGRIELIDAEGRRSWENEQSAGENDCRTLIASLVLSLRVARGAFAPPAGGSERPPPSEPTIHVQGVSLPPVGFAPGPALFPPSFDYRPPEAGPWGANEPSYPAFRISTATALALGMTPGLTARFALGLGLAWPGLSVSIEARNVVPSAEHFRGHTLRATRWEGAFVPCVGRGAVFACGLLTLGGLWTHLTGPHHDSGGYFHAGAGVRLGIEMEVSSNIGLATYGDVEGSFFANGVRMDHFSVWIESPVQFALSIAVTGLFPEAKQ